MKRHCALGRVQIGCFYHRCLFCSKDPKAFVFKLWALVAGSSKKNTMWFSGTPCWGWLVQFKHASAAVPVTHFRAFWCHDVMCEMTFTIAKYMWWVATGKKMPWTRELQDFIEPSVAFTVEMNIFGRKGNSCFFFFPPSLKKKKRNFLADAGCIVQISDFYGCFFYTKHRNLHLWNHVHTFKYMVQICFTWFLIFHLYRIHDFWMCSFCKLQNFSTSVYFFHLFWRQLRLRKTYSKLIIDNTNVLSPAGN